MTKLASLPNIGAVTEKDLNAVGIHSAEDLRCLGAREAWLRLLARDPGTCMNCLCGLEGAVQGVRWHSLPDTDKKDLKAFFKMHKG